MIEKNTWFFRQNFAEKDTKKKGEVILLKFTILLLKDRKITNSINRKCIFYNTSITKISETF